jgi:hypothetical protein
MTKRSNIIWSSQTEIKSEINPVFQYKMYLGRISVLEQNKTKNHYKSMEFDVVRGNGIDHVASPCEGVH